MAAAPHKIRRVRCVDEPVHWSIAANDLYVDSSRPGIEGNG